MFPALKRVLLEVEQVADTDATVLILVESRTGKELVAHGIHRRSRRKAKPLIIVNCAGIPAYLMESEFFGHEKGAFSGATQKRVRRRADRFWRARWPALRFCNLLFHKRCSVAGS